MMASLFGLWEGIDRDSSDDVVLGIGRGSIFDNSFRNARILL